MIPASAKTNETLGDLFSSGQLALPERVVAPLLDLPPILDPFAIRSFETITLYRGDFNEAEARGHFSRIWTARAQGAIDISFERFVKTHGKPAKSLERFFALAKAGDPYAACLEAALRISSGTPEFVNWLIDKHTDKVPWSPLVSTTYDPALAARHAPSHYNTMSVYRCEVASSRCLVDAYNIGGTGKAGEIMVIGWIPSSESNRVQLDDRNCPSS